MPAGSVRLSRLAGLVLVLVIAGCAPEPVIEPPSPSITPSPSTSAVTLPAPSPVLGFDCADLVPPGVGTGLLTERLPELTESVMSISVDFVRPHDFATMQAGGLSCSTDNGESPTLPNGNYNPAWVSIAALILPDAGAQFEELALPPTGTDELTSCNGGVAPGSCFIDLLIEDTWVSLKFFGVDLQLIDDDGEVPVQIAAIEAELRGVVGDAARRSNDWSPPADTVPLDTRCDVFFPPGRIEQDLPTSGDVILVPYEDYITAEFAARQLAPALDCPWLDGDLRRHGSHSVLLGGEWAFRVMEDAGAFGAHASLKLSHLSQSDVAFATCSIDGDRCSAQLVVGRNWVQVVVYLSANGLDEDGAMSEVEGIAQTVVDTLRT